VRRNCTPLTAVLSLAVAVTATDVPLTVAPSAGALIATTGAVVSGGGGGPLLTASTMSLWTSPALSARL
jgi:hypothetical protein